MRTTGCLLVLAVVAMGSFSSCKKPAPPTADLPPPPPSTPLNSEKLKEIAALIEVQRLIGYGRLVKRIENCRREAHYHVTLEKPTGSSMAT
jgi:hypothetical protein